MLSTVGIDSRTVGTRTVYTAVYTSGKGDISGRNVPDGAPFIISQRSTFEWMPDISHNRVVWWETGGRVMMRDLKTHQRTFVHNGSRPRIDGELVTWDGGGHGGEFVISYVRGAKIYVRNVVRSTSVVAIAQKDLTCLFPSISGHRVVWESGPAQRVLSHIHIYGAGCVAAPAAVRNGLGLPGPQRSIDPSGGSSTTGYDRGTTDAQAGGRRRRELTRGRAPDPAVALLVAVVSVLLALALGTALFLLLPAAL